MPRILGSKKENASYACFQQALQNGTTFKINKRKTKVLSRTKLQRIFCHLAVRKAITNTDMQSISTVHLDLKVLHIISTPRSEKVQNLIFSRLKTTFQDAISRDKYIREETIRNSRSQVKDSRSQQVNKSTSQIQEV